MFTVGIKQRPILIHQMCLVGVGETLNSACLFLRVWMSHLCSCICVSTPCLTPRSLTPLLLSFTAQVCWLFWTLALEPGEGPLLPTTTTTTTTTASSSSQSKILAYPRSHHLHTRTQDPAAPPPRQAHDRPGGHCGGAAALAGTSSKEREERRGREGGRAELLAPAADDAPALCLTKQTLPVPLKCATPASFVCLSGCRVAAGVLVRRSRRNNEVDGWLPWHACATFLLLPDSSFYSQSMRDMRGTFTD